MNKLKTLLILCGLYPFSMMANVRPVVTATIGADTTAIYRSTTITMISPLQNTYIGNREKNTQAIVGVFLGGETELSPQWGWQYGIRYFQTHSLNVSGNVYQFSDPLYNNLIYDYQIRNRRVLAETKFFANILTRGHPYVIGDLGVGSNHAYAYQETPMSSADAPMTQYFANDTATTLSYALGLGLDIDCTDHVRLGINYRWSNLGKARLGTSPLQDSTTVIHHPNLRTNELLLEISYVV